jgi:hypothetical protein
LNVHRGSLFSAFVKTTLPPNSDEGASIPIFQRTL